MNAMILGSLFHIILLFYYFNLTLVIVYSNFCLILLKLIMAMVVNSGAGYKRVYSIISNNIDM